jgi:Ca-activated chloride channel family protein
MKGVKNMYKKLMHTCLGLMALTMLQPAVSLADGIIIPPPGVNVAVKYHHVTVDIQNQVANTEIDQVFINDSDRDSLEALYIFPLPEGATFSRFSMFVDGEELTAEILDADSARAIYESIVRRRLDPALLEYLGRGLFRARVYPIRAHGEKRIKISYTELLPYDNGLVRYLYPLSTEKFSSKPLETVSVTVAISSPVAIKSIFSPTHDIQIEKTDDFNAKAIYADENVTPGRDFVLYYTVSPDDVGLHLLTHRPPQEDGFYLFTAAPKQDVEESQVIKKRVLFVLDRSGSMSGQKIEQAKNGLKFVLSNLNPEDWFNIVDFSSEVRRYRDEPLVANGSNVSSALAYVTQLSAGGGTNINEALLAAMAQTARDSLANMVIFLTDGQPTVGVTDNEQIRRNVQAANTHSARLFVFGVGYDVNTHLLDNLAYGNHGVSTYVRPEEDIEIAVSSFFTKISSPVLANLALDFGGIAVYDQFPSALPDLFKGSQLIQFGRYRNHGATTITLSGEINGAAQQFTLAEGFPEIKSDFDFIARLWALRKIGYLLDQIRLHGENDELISEIVALSKKYGIITPYTSFLILEDQVLPGAFSGLSPQTGERAVDAAANVGSYRDATSVSRVQPEGVKYVGGKAFFLRKDFWIDSEYLEGQPTIVFEFGSEAYFDFLLKHAEFGKYFAIGKNLIVSMGEQAYRVQEKDKTYVPDLPTKFRLLQNYPNPFNPFTRIEYEVPADARVKLSVFDVTGRQVRTLVDGFKLVGFYRISWDGSDERGNRLPSGVYIYQLVVNGKITDSRKLALVK